MYRIFLVLGILLIAVGLSAPALAAQILANDDVYVRSDSADLNTDGYGLWLQKWTGQDFNAYVEFTLGSTAVSAATLKMYLVCNWWAAPQTIQLKGKEYSFDETTMTWNTQPADRGTWGALGTWDIPAWTNTNVDKSLDITGFYNSNLGKTVTIYLYESYYGYNAALWVAAFEDREGGLKAHQYTTGTYPGPRIDYTPVPEPGSFATLMLGLAGIYFGRRKR